MNALGSAEAAAGDIRSADIKSLSSLILLSFILLSFLLVSCQNTSTARTEISLQDVLLTPDDVDPDLTVRGNNTGKRTKADYNLEEEEWEEFQWVDGYKVTFENQQEINEKYRALFNYDSRYLNQKVMFEEYKETIRTDQKFTVLGAPTIGEDSIAFFFSYTQKAPSGELLEWTEVDVTFIKYDVYENIGVLQLSEAIDVEKSLEDAVRYAKIVEKKIDAAYRN